MATYQTETIARLRQEILPLQGYKPAKHTDAFDAGLGVIKYSFPNNTFPLGAIHEFKCNTIEDVSATSAFITGILSHFKNSKGAIIWISQSCNVYPPALTTYGINPEQVFFITLTTEKEVFWAIEEALGCKGITAVIAYINEITFTQSRRLQLAVEASLVTGFIVRYQPKNIHTTSIARWHIQQLPSNNASGVPGVGYAKWNVLLEKVRNGTAGQWQLTWEVNTFKHEYKQATIHWDHKLKTG